MFISDASIIIPVSSGVYSDITGFSPGTLIGWSFNSNQLVCIYAGTYLILWNVVLSASKKGEIRVAVKNATTVFPTTRCIHVVPKDELVYLSGFGIGLANLGDVARLGLTFDADVNITVKDSKLTLIRQDS